MHQHNKPAGHRLRSGRTSEPGRVYLITTVTLNRQPFFTEIEAARSVIQVLQAQRTVQTLTYVLMPDHLHWLIQLADEPLHTVVGRMKSISARAAKRKLWQRGFHDRAARKDDDLRAMARYVIANPLRAGLVESIGDYPHWDAVWL